MNCDINRFIILYFDDLCSFEQEICQHVDTLIRSLFFSVLSLCRSLPRRSYGR